MQINITITRPEQLDALKPVLALLNEPVAQVPATCCRQAAAVGAAPELPQAPGTEAVKEPTVRKGRSNKVKDVPPPEAVPTAQEMAQAAAPAEPPAPAPEVTVTVTPAKAEEPTPAPTPEVVEAEAVTSTTYDEVKAAFMKVLRGFDLEQAAFAKWLGDTFGITNGKELPPEKYAEAVQLAEAAARSLESKKSVNDLM